MEVSSVNMSLVGGQRGETAGWKELSMRAMCHGFPGCLPAMKQRGL